jgi:Icc-related predicted phosphoesterase
MNIAVVGDVHGHLALMYAVLGRWQSETGQSIDLILQCGDMGAFLSTSPLDNATRRWSENDPEELGFAEFAGAAAPKTLLDSRPPLVFIPGNHEDFEFLEQCERASLVDEAVYRVSEDGRISALKTGRIWTFEAAGERLRIAGLSGVANRTHKKGRHPRYHLADEEALRLSGEGAGAIDLMISHDAPDGLIAEDYRGMAGSAAIRLAIEETHPRLAFFAHYDQLGEWEIGPTHVFGLGKCSYVPAGRWPVAPGGIILVRWGEGSANVERLSAEWLDKATRFNWRHWGTPK